SDKIFGATAVSASLFIFIYYSTWTFVVPFLNEDSILQKFFLPYEYAIYLPAAVLVAGVSFITAFFVKTTSQNKSKKAK
ncbi:dolichyl-phosphate mannosyltransferase polypeptide 2, partial [Parasitella parasitica]